MTSKAASARSVELCVASFNTRVATELCIRSARHTVDSRVVIHIGDSASADGSAELIRSLEDSHNLEVEILPEPRRHHEWLDYWYQKATADYLVFVDSDVDFRAPGWLDDMIDCADKTGAALVAGKIRQRGPGSGGYSHAAERPEVHLVLLVMGKLRGRITASFAWYEEPDLDQSGFKVGFDVGGLFMREVQLAGLGAVEMDAPFRSKYRHWGRLSHAHDGHQTRVFMAKTTLKRLRIRQRLLVERLKDRASSTSGHLTRTEPI